MARVAFPLVLQSPSTGSAIVGAVATITQHVVGASLGSGAPATIFTSETGAGTTATNQITTDNLGRWTQGAGAGYAQYWLPEGTYDIVITGSGLTGFTITRELASGSRIGAWTNLTLASGIAAQAGDTPAARLEGDLVRLKGQFLNNSGATLTSGANLATLPSGYFPPINRNYPCGSFNTSVGTAFQISVGSTGTISMANTSTLLPNGDAVEINGITYSLV